MVQDIEEIDPDLHVHSLRKLGVLHHAEVEVGVVRSSEGVASYVAEMLTSRCAISAALVDAGPRTRNRERRQVQDSARRTGARKGIPDQIRTPEALATA